MCFRILLSPAAAIAKARQKRDMNKTVMELLQVSILFSFGATVVTARSSSNIGVLSGSFLSSFAVLVILAAVLGMVVKIAAAMLGGKGGYYEGLTAITYALAPFAFGLLAVSFLSFIPVAGKVLAALVLFPVLATALSTLYRAIKELFRTDLLTSFVTVSITLTVLVVSVVFLSVFA